MIQGLRRLLGLRRPVSLKRKHSGDGHNKAWRYSAYDKETGGYVISGPPVGFDTEEEAISHAKTYLNVVGE